MGMMKMVITHNGNSSMEQVGRDDGCKEGDAGEKWIGVTKMIIMAKIFG
jgi:hypothetical protein